MGRRPLTEDEVRAKVHTYCERYGVSPGPGGLPPFPTGRRETRQHREWLTVYRALQRARLRRTSGPAPAEATAAAVECPICARPLDRAVPYRRRGPRAASSLHPACADLVRLAEALGPAAVAALGPFLWPSRRSPRG